MRAGQLRHYISIQRATTTQGTAGGITQSWSDLATVWAQVEDLAAHQALAVQTVWSDATTRITIRYRSDVAAGMRVTEGARTWNVLGVLDRDGRAREATLMCQEVIS